MGKNNMVRAMLALVLLAVVSPIPARATGAGYALQFDGVNDFVTLAPAANILTSGWQNTKTVSLWIKPTGATPICSYANVAWCDNIFGDRPRWWGIARGAISGDDRIWIWNFDGNTDQIGIAYTPGEWVHISLVHGSGVLRAFKNGVEVPSIPSGTTLQPNTGALPVLHVGGVINNASRNWTYQGLIDEIQVWNTARSAAEIQADMSRALLGDEPGLAAYYRMSDGAGLTLTDDSLNSYNWNGTLFDGGNGVPPNGAPPQWVASDAFIDPNNPPIATDDPTSTYEDTAVVVTVLANDTDPDGDPLTVVSVGAAAHGTATTDGNTVTYTPNTNFNGVESFGYTVSDGRGGSASAIITVAVLPVNDPPQALDDSTSTSQDNAVTVAVLANDADPDGDALSVAAVGSAGQGATSTDGASIIYTPTLGYTGTDSFSYTVTDGNGGQATAQVMVTVLAWTATATKRRPATANRFRPTDGHSDGDGHIHGDANGYA